MILGCFWKFKVILGLWVVNLKPSFGLGFEITIANWVGFINVNSPGGYFGVKRIGMTVGNPRKLP